ncbi:TPA: DUF5960 family protein, partial [Streptococcus suis]
FLTDDLMNSMASSGINYFVLNKEKSKDNRDHYFIFKIETYSDNKLIRKFIYQKTTTSLE